MVVVMEVVVAVLVVEMLIKVVVVMEDEVHLKASRNLVSASAMSSACSSSASRM